MKKANKAKPTETKNLNQITRKTQWIKPFSQKPNEFIL